MKKFVQYGIYLLACIFWKTVARPIALYLYLRFLFIEWTSKITVKREHTIGNQTCIYVNWHRHLPYLVPHHGKYHRWLMVSNALYIESIALWCKLSGLQLIRGASKQGGRTALYELKNILQDKESVVLAVDGPNGPGFKVKKGCIELAQQTGYPIVPVKYTCKKGVEKTKRWDKMLLPSLFDDIIIFYGTPVFIKKEESLDIASSSIEKSLNNL